MNNILYQNSSAKTSQNQQPIDKKLKNTSGEIYSFSTVFPFDLFPDRVVVDYNRVNIITRVFFQAEKIHSVFIEDITDVLIYLSPFLAQLVIVDRNFRENEIKVDHVRPSDAQKARNIIEGLMVSKKQKVNIPHFDTKNQLIDYFIQLGSTSQFSK